MAPRIRFDTKSGRFTFASQNDLADINELLRRTGASGNREEHVAMAAAIIGPIKQVADYNEWTRGLFTVRPVTPGEIIRIAVTKPSVIALSTSVNGEVLFTRPNRSYSTIDYQSMDTGIEVGWDDLRAAGWNMMSGLIKEAGEVLARKRDTAGKAILDAAITLASHSTNSTGGVLAKSVVDAVFKSAASLGWKIQNVVINSGTIMDMTNWVMPSNSMWEMPTEMGQDIVRQGYVSNYGGATWTAFQSAPSTEVYFTASPEDMAAYHFSLGETREAQDIDIRKRVDLMTWDEANGYYLGNPYAIWKIAITA